MTWLKIDDAFGAHPKIMLAGNEAVGLWVRCASWSSAHLTDGFVPEAVVLMYGSKRLAQRLVDARLFEPRSVGPDGPGYAVHDFLIYNPSRNEVESERARRNELRDPELVAAVKQRDGNRCRYCAQVVKWTDRRGPTGGTLDHVVPGLAGGVDNVVVACRACNGAKKNRTPAEAGMILLPPPGEEPPTAGARPAPKPSSDLGPTQVRLAAVPDPEADAPGTGRVGSGTGRDDTAPASGPVPPAEPAPSGAGRRRNRDRYGAAPRRPAESGTVPRVERGTERCPVHHVDQPCRACPAVAAP